MRHLTVMIDDQILLKAHQHAIKQGTTIDALVRNFLKNYIDSIEQDSQATNHIESAQQSTTASVG